MNSQSINDANTTTASCKGNITIGRPPKPPTSDSITLISTNSNPSGIPYEVQEESSKWTIPSLLSESSSGIENCHSYSSTVSLNTATNGNGSNTTNSDTTTIGRSNNRVTSGSISDSMGEQPKASTIDQTITTPAPSSFSSSSHEVTRFTTPTDIDGTNATSPQSDRSQHNLNIGLNRYIDIDPTNITTPVANTTKHITKTNIETNTDISRHANEKNQISIMTAKTPVSSNKRRTVIKDNDSMKVDNIPCLLQDVIEQEQETTYESEAANQQNDNGADQQSLGSLLQNQQQQEGETVNGENDLITPTLVSKDIQSIPSFQQTLTKSTSNNHHHSFDNNHNGPNKLGEGGEELGLFVYLQRVGNAQRDALENFYSNMMDGSWCRHSSKPCMGSGAGDHANGDDDDSVVVGEGGEINYFNCSLPFVNQTTPSSTSMHMNSSFSHKNSFDSVSRYDPFNPKMIAPKSCEYCGSKSTLLCNITTSKIKCERPKLYFEKKRPPFHRNSGGMDGSHNVGDAGVFQESKQLRPEEILLVRRNIRQGPIGAQEDDDKMEDEQKVVGNKELTTTTIGKMFGFF